MPDSKQSPLDTTSYWQSSQPLPRFPRLDSTRHVDVVIIGGGITGITAAYLLTREGRRVALLERRRCAAMDTGHTSAHLTCVTDTPLTELVEKFGEDHARAVWDAGLAAIAELDEIARRESIDCSFAWVPGYLHTPALKTLDAKADDRLRREAKLAQSLGFDARYVARAPFVDRPAMEIDAQARFHPRQFLRGLLEMIDGGGSMVLEHTEVTEVKGDPLTVCAGEYEITCDDVVVATHNPIVGIAGMAASTFLQTKLSLYTSYVAGGRTAPGQVPDALFW
ncbi:MAG: FAD-binding oxidoreductase, partial [Acidobacteriota bacterium]